MKEVRISVFGLGYVGIVSACCFANNGIKVIGVDISKKKVSQINKMIAPIAEPNLDKLLEKVINNSLFRATVDASEAIEESNVSLVCVGTPSKLDGSIELNHLEAVLKEIGSLVANKQNYHTVVIRSTVVPGTIRGIALPILEKYSNKKCGSDFGLAFVPEFLREGSAIEDFYEPLKTVIGEYDFDSSVLVKKIFDGFGGVINCVSLETAEMTKYLDNSWHALKVTFANEIGAICKNSGIDSHELMKIFFQDTKLNISKHYLMPGFAFGGSCLPKDLRAICKVASDRNIDLPLMNSILRSNNIQIERICNLIKNYKLSKIGIVGITFKENTDDLRESPSIKLASKLIKDGYSIKLIDHTFDLTKVMGLNRKYIFDQIPNIESCLMLNSSSFLSEVEIIVLAVKDKSYNSLISQISQEHIVLDLVKLVEKPTAKYSYEGVYW